MRPARTSCKPETRANLATSGKIANEPEMAAQGETLEEIIAMIRDLIRCRFDTVDERLQWPIRPHFVNDPVLAAHTA